MASTVEVKEWEQVKTVGNSLFVNKKSPNPRGGKELHTVRKSRIPFLLGCMSS